MRSYTKLIIVLVFVALWCYLAFSGFLKLPELDSWNMASKGMSIDWKTVDLLNKTLPADLKKDNVDIETGRIQIEGVDVFYRKSLPPAAVKSSGQSLLLLHGRSFKSETWEKLGTLNIAAALGHTVVAIDLPGYGETTDKYSGDKSKFIFSVVKSLLNGTHPILVSPSMSGEYSVKFVGEHADLLSGYVPVAPVATNSVPQSTLESIMLPTMILYGSNDKTPMAKQAPENLGVMPNSQVVVFKDAGHACYLDKPDLYHQLLHNFMELLRN